MPGPGPLALTITDLDHVDATRSLRAGFQNPAPAGDAAGLEPADGDRALDVVLDDGQRA